MYRDCRFIKEEGYPKKLNNNTFNSNDKEGMILLILLMALFYSKNIYNLILTILYIYEKQIRVIYLFSFILTLFIRTPPSLTMETYFPNNRLFEDKFEIIQKEVKYFLKQTNDGKECPFTKNTFDGANENIGRDIEDERGWRICPIKIAGKNIKAMNKYFPELVKILNVCPEISSCIVSSLDSKTYIPIHNGYYKGLLRYMFPIIIPKDKENVFLCNNYKKYIWIEGKGILWDDTYPHKVFNNTDEKRVVLYMDIVRKMPEPFNSFNKKILDIISGSSIVRNEIKKTEKKFKLE
uniref:Aspartyl/asparaginyl beta-hydroxylase n=1 Tax=Megaviridae environmental sample TaxID=1737588 RepID=A0A5J6VJW3_9VIRU|nr:MAG: aspartyl/asparaginyl beta-hydroxylase [Megaviridae environmental sample]